MAVHVPKMVSPEARKLEDRKKKQVREREYL